MPDPTNTARQRTIYATIPTRPPLSPAGQAVIDACNRAIDREATCLAREPLTRDIAAAALRAAVAATQQRQYADCWVCGAADLLVIAAELEGTP